MKSLRLRIDAHGSPCKGNAIRLPPCKAYQEVPSRLFLLLDVTQEEEDVRLFFFRVTELAINIVRNFVKILQMVQILLVQKHTIIDRGTR
jgi:hypothetical protein